MYILTGVTFGRSLTLPSQWLNNGSALIIDGHLKQLEAASLLYPLYSILPVLLFLVWYLREKLRDKKLFGMLSSKD